jgi:hypothetical protein
MTKKNEDLVEQPSPPATQQVPQDPEITVVLKLNEINTIIGSLDELPHKVSRLIIDKLRFQAISQLQQMQGGAQAEQ